MKFRISSLFLWPAIALLSGCAVQHYRPAPIVPTETASQLESRSLRDPGLRDYMEKALGHPVSWPLRQWDLPSLTLAALYFSPQMEIARDRLAAAQGGIVTAGEHPNPSLSLTPGIPSPWLFDLPLVFPIETHGKRALRIEQAQDLSSAAEMAVAGTEWSVASGVRTALLAYRMARARLVLSQATERTEDRHVTLLHQRLLAGEEARPPLEAAELALSNLQFAVSVNQGQVATARAALAGAIGVPVDALDGLEMTWPNFGRLPTLASLSPQRIERDAVLNRLDVRAALDQYAAADAALRLQLARQYPNFNIGPGYAFEEGNNYFTVPFSIVLPIRNRNQGPIAQAEALRKEAAANFLAVQTRAIAQSQQALAAYRSALADLHEANRPILNQGRQVQMTRRAVAAGESNHLQLNTVMLAGAVYSQQRLQALGQAQAALGALEDAVEQPLDPSAWILPVPSPKSVAPGRKESEQ
ncbi:MAG TPA: TolC family protein [Candidatus Dormibacteraeota bacterium]|nr:TolC family protein [Candidatus Dormibacteraeota bacterium]